MSCWETWTFDGWFERSYLPNIFLSKKSRYLLEILFLHSVLTQESILLQDVCDRGINNIPPQDSLY